MQGIYAIRHIATGRSYIGSSVNIARRWKEHRMRLANGQHPALHLLRAWRAYGSEAFEFLMLEECDVATELIRIERETYWMRLMQPVFNTAPIAGSVLGMRRSDEVRAKMSAAQKLRYSRNPTKLLGRPRSIEARAAISAGKKGKHHSAEHIANLSAALKGRSSPRKGVKLSDETKAKISLSKTGIKQDPAVVARRVATRLQRKVDKQRSEVVVSHQQ